MVKKIAIISGTRAEYGILKPLISDITNDEALELQLIVTGMHLLESHGNTIEEIRTDKFTIAATIEMYKKEKKDYYSSGLAKGIEGMAKAFVKLKTEVVVVFGDRLEAFAGTLAAATLQLPIIHIHGGDSTNSGHIDESIRHSISKFAHLHLTACEEHSERLTKMGEETWRIHTVGALGLDSYRTNTLQKEETFETLGLPPEAEPIVSIYHPVNINKEEAGKEMMVLLDSLKKTEQPCVIIYPNNDEGNEAIIESIKHYEKEKNFFIRKNIPHNQFVCLLKNAKLLVGNSSCGIIEAPYIGLPTLNIGLRNKNRNKSENIIFCDSNDINSSLEKSLSKTFGEKAANCESPFGDGHTSGKIVKILKEMKINDKLLKKMLTY